MLMVTMSEHLTGFPDDFHVARAKIRDVASFIIGVETDNSSDLHDEIWGTVRDYSKHHPDMNIGDPYDRFDSWRSIESLNPEWLHLYQKHPYLLHRPFIKDDPTDIRVVHIESLYFSLRKNAIPESNASFKIPLGGTVQEIPPTLF